MAKKQTKSKTKSKDSSPELTFEESLESIKTILSELESGQLPLSQSLERYEAGIGHLKNCHVTLNEARKKIELLVRVDEKGNPVTESFDSAATYSAEPSSSSSQAGELDDDEQEDVQNELDDYQDEDGLF